MKRSHFRASVIATLVTAGCALAACGDDDTSNPVINPGIDAGREANAGDTGTNDSDRGDAGLVAVTLHFKAKVGNADFKCGTKYDGIGTTGQTVEPVDLRFFVANVALVDGNGKEAPVTLDVRSPWQTAEVALLDFEDATGRCSNGNAEVNAKVTGLVAPGTYTAIAFTNGIPSATNHADPATSPPPLTAGGMTWGWLFGHLFVKAELTASADAGLDAGPGYGLFHLGSTGCTNSPDGGDNDDNNKPPTTCGAPNQNRVKLTGFDATTKSIVFDVKSLFASTDVSVQSTCHSMMSAACGSLFTNVGLDYTDAGGIMSTAPAFRVE